ncbi:glycosyltransferase family 4 protein [Massilia aerilata]|uniref:Glycosyltransferase family 4 protein n=1 Tax=Massilia aerilata TaxID=453817 RepID=A0ABW0RTX5_9BURK
MATTVPETLATILARQPRYLADFFDVTLVTSPGQELKKVAAREEVTVMAVPMVRGISLIKDITSVISMCQSIRRVKPSIIHSYTPKAGLVCMLAGWICGVPIRIHTFTGLIFPTELGFRRRLLVWTDRILCACATHLVPEGEGVKRDLERYRITKKPLNVIGYGNIAGVDASFFAPTALGVAPSATCLRNRLGLKDDDFVFCFVGRLNKDKGLSELLAAFKTLPQTANLLLVGKIDVTSPLLQRDIEIIRSHPRIFELGFVDDVRPALAVSNVLVLPSYREGFPNVLLQAGAMELPAIATDINGCNEIIEKNFNGWLVPAREVKPLADVMLYALEASRTLLREMGKRARIRVTERFCQKDHWKRMVLFYRNVLGE